MGTPDENVEQSNQPPVLFIAYSKKDKKYLDQLKIHLNVLNALCVADVWDDTRIMSGKDWHEEIKWSLSRARVAILLVSENFLDNKFILNKELPTIDQAASEERLRIYWILVSECTWELFPAIQRRQAATPGDRTLKSMGDEERNKVLVNIVKQIHNYLTTVKQDLDPGQKPEEPDPSLLIPTNAPSLALIPATRGWLIRDGNEWRKETKKIEVKGYKEQLADGIAITMIQIPKGEFLMGSPKDESDRSLDEGPQRKVSLRSFFMAQTPVTQAQWEVVAGWAKVFIDLPTNPSRFKGDNRPVEKVNWLEAIEFCERLSQRTGLRYTLPSEAQWEYACRAGTSSKFTFGQKLSKELACYDGSSNIGTPFRAFQSGTKDVASFSANAWGLYDTHGNVLEWCLDNWHENYQGALIDESPWVSADSFSRLLRGGSWYDSHQNCRSSYRIHMKEYEARDDVGFRIACTSEIITDNFSITNNKL